MNAHGSCAAELTQRRHQPRDEPAAAEAGEGEKEMPLPSQGVGRSLWLSSPGCLCPVGVDQEGLRVPKSNPSSSLLPRVGGAGLQWSAG